MNTAYNRLLIGSISCLIFIITAGSTGCKNKEPQTAAPATEVVEAPTPTPPPPPAPLAPPVPDPKPKNAKVKISTRYGDMIVKLYDETPGHRDNFLMLAEKKFFDDVLFHRCIKGFMIQGGDPDSKGAPANMNLGMGGPGYTIPAEFNPKLIHKKGALAAARQGGPINPTRASSGSQFYIVQGTKLNDMQLDQTQQYIQNSHTPGFTYTPDQRNMYKTIGGTAQLDMDYTVFGEVISGLNIIDSIAAQPANAMNRPLNDIKMTIEVIK